MTDLDPLTVPWHPVVNDLIGGWAVATADLPLSAINTRTREVCVVADSSTERMARHIAELHNASLDAGLDPLEPHHAAARKATPDERAILDVLKDRALATQRKAADRAGQLDLGGTS